MSTVEPSAKPPAAQRVIKRYANRKLYDTRDSRYVTLPQIAGFVRGGEDVQIIDNTTKENVTNVTLAQIIYEEERKGDADERDTSVGTLRNFIQTGGEKLISSLRDGRVGVGVGKLMSASRREGHSEPPELLESARQKIIAQSREALDSLERLADERVRALVATAIAPVQHLHAEIRRLEAKIDDLESKLVRIGRGGPTDSRAPSSPPASDDR